MDKEMKTQNLSWGQIQQWAQDKQMWKVLVMVLYASEHEEIYVRQTKNRTKNGCWRVFLIWK